MRKVNLASSIVTNEPYRERPVLSLQFKINRKHVRKGRINIRCEASILDVWKQSKNVEILVQTHARDEIAPSTNYHQSLDMAIVMFDIFLVYAWLYEKWCQKYLWWKLNIKFGFILFKVAFNLEPINFWKRKDLVEIENPSHNSSKV